MSLYDEKVSAKLSRLVYETLAANAELLAFFGAAGIRWCDYEDLEGPIRPPFLAVVPGIEEYARNLEDTIAGEIPINLMVYLPRATPTNESLSVPSAPTAAQGAAGNLTGAYRYRVTGCNENGESFASVYSNLLTVAGKKITVTVPTVSGATQRRLWRTEAGRIAFRYLDTIADNVSTTYSDDLADSYLGDELAPVKGFARNLMDHIRGVLWTGESLHAAGVDNADATLLFKNKADRILPRRNLRQIVTTARFGTLYQGTTGEVLTDHVGG